jgi:hypothetical protein
VRREDDKVTRWILDKWVYPHAADPDLWFGCVIARFVNWPDTLAELGFPVPWDQKHFLDVMAAREARGDKCYGSAYTIRADNTGRCNGPGSKPRYQVEQVFNPLWRDRERMRPMSGETLEHYHGRLSERHGMGGGSHGQRGFMGGQVISDLKYVEPLRSARDWMTFAVSGPGSRPGLNRVLGDPVDKPWSESVWREGFDILREAIQPDLEKLGLGDLDAQSLQSCLCELDKMGAHLDGRRERLALHCLGLAGHAVYQPRIRAPRKTTVALFPSYAFIAI